MPQRSFGAGAGVWRFFALLLASVAAVVLVACGSSDDSATSTPGGDGDTSGGSSATATATTGAGTESGDASAATDTSGSGGTLTIAMSAGNIPIPEQFQTEGGEGRRFVGVNIYDGLLNWDSAQGDEPPKPIPGLAESYEVADDDLTWTFHLRQGVTFHDGTPFDSSSVMFSLDRIMDQDFEYYSSTMAASGGSYTAQIASYEALDEFTVQIVTKRPWAFLVYDIALICIVSPDAVETYGNDDYAQHPVGTGPFKVDKYIDGQVLELLPFEDYWDGAPKLERLILRPMPEPATRLAALQSGEVDWAEVPPPDSLDLLEASGYNILLKGYPHIIIYALNTYRAPFDDVRARQAIAYGLDREGMMAIINNVGIPADQYFYDGHPWRDDTFEGYGYDPERAKALLAEAGYADGLEITIPYPSGGSGNMFPGPMNEKFQQDMAAIGVDVNLVPLEWNTILSIYRAGFGADENMQYDGMYFSPNTQAPMFAFGSYLTERIPPSGCCNLTGYSNAEADTVMEQAAAAFDLDEQNELLKQFQAIFIREVPAVPVTHDLNLRVLSPQVRGWVQPQSWWGDFTGVWMAE